MFSCHSIYAYKIRAHKDAAVLLPVTLLSDTTEESDHVTVIFPSSTESLR